MGARGRGVGLLLLAAAIPAAAGCAGGPRPLYEWGRYETLLYRTAVDPGSADPAEDARLLGEDLESAAEEGRPAPPGVRLHLAWLYLRMGNEAGAAQLMEAEREAFPESAVFVDRLLGREGP